MGRYQMRVAQVEDGKDLLKLERETMPGLLGLRYDSRSDYFKAAQVHGDSVTTIVAEADGKLIGKGVTSKQQVFINGESTRVGYHCGLYCHSKYRRSVFVARGYQLFRKLRSPEIPFYFTTIAKENIEVRQILEKPRSFMPDYTYLCDYTVHVFQARTRKVNPAVRRATEGDREALVDFLYEQGKLKNGFPDVRGARRSGNIIGIPIHEFFIFRDSAIRGVIGVWDQRGVRNIHASSYSRLGRIIKPLWNATMGRFNYPKFPPLGSVLDLRYGSLFCIENNNVSIAKLLFDALLNASKSAQYVLVGVSSMDSLDGFLRNQRGYRYSSCVYSVTYDSIFSFDRKPIYLEVGML